MRSGIVVGLACVVAGAVGCGGVQPPTSAATSPNLDGKTTARDEGHRELRREVSDLFGGAPSPDEPSLAAPPAKIVGGAESGEGAAADDAPFGAGADRGIDGNGPGGSNKGALDGKRQEAEARADAEKRAEEEERERVEPSPRRGPAPKAATTQTTEARLTASQVDDVVSSHGDLFSSCSPVEAVVSLRATVAPTGAVMEVSASRSSPDDAKMRDCVTAAFRTLSFPRLADGAPSRLAFDLRLAPR